MRIKQKQKLLRSLKLLCVDLFPAAHVECKQLTLDSQAKQAYCERMKSLFADCKDFKDCARASILEYERRIKILRDYLKEPEPLREAAQKVLYDATVSHYKTLDPAMRELDKALDTSAGRH